MVHDLVPLLHPGWVTPRTRSMHGYKFSRTTECDLVFVNSAYTGRDVEEHLSVPGERIRVAPPGVSGEYTADGERAELGLLYVLSLATLEPRKNLETLVEAGETAGAESWRSPSQAAQAGATSRCSTHAPQFSKLGFVAGRESPSAGRAARPRSSTRLGSRASACRSWRRWLCGVPGGRFVAPFDGRGLRRRGGSRRPRRPRTRSRSASGLRSSGARSCVQPGGRTPRSSPGGGAARSTCTHSRRLWHEGICRWSGELGPKFKTGDRQAPEGFYTITPGQMNPNSSYYLAFNMGFPNAYDRANGYTGAFLMVHGDCLSAGCYAMTDEQIAEITRSPANPSLAARSRSRSRPIRSE